MVKSFITLTSIVFALALCIVKAQAAVFNNKAYAKGFESHALALSGNYVLTNVKTGKKVAFNKNGGTPNLALGSSSVSMKISRVKGNWVRFDVGTSKKCFSAQWDHSHGINWASTLYACCPKASNCDNGGNQGPLRFQKQSWLVVPADSSAIRAASQAIRKRSHPRDFRVPDPEPEVESEPEEEEDDDAGEVSERDGEELHERATASSSKAYYIIAVDHVLDMKTRVITGKIMTSAGNYKSLALADLDYRDKAQQWRITKA